jgi:hypothetical protein
MASDRNPWKTRVTCYQEYVFIGSLPSNGHGMGHIENIRYFWQVFSGRCVATRTALLTACLLKGVYRAVA